MAIDDEAGVLKELWRPLRYSPREIEDVLTQARLGRLQVEWATSSEAMRLTLAWILRKATRIQAQLCREVSHAEFKPVLTASRRLAFEIQKLQGRDGPPPPMPVDDNGRSPWEAWVRSAKGLAQLGARPRSDPQALGSLVAFYQLALGKEKAPFSNHLDAPLTRFLRASFECAEARLLNWQTKTGYVDRRHSLHAPKPGALAGQLKKLGDNEVNLAEVRKQFERFQRAISEGATEHK